MIGLTRETVRLCPHEREWETAAAETIERLRKIFGERARDIHHVGSTSIKSIMAKPIIDIAVGVNAFEEIYPLIPELEAAGFHYRPESIPAGQLLFACGSWYEGSGDSQTHFIHVVRFGGMEWLNYNNFRDYLNAFPEKAREYEAVKRKLAEEYPHDRQSYVDGKSEFISYTLRKAMVWSYLGKTAAVKIDRPLGYVHDKGSYTLTYPLNYGYIPGVLGGDGEELDVYILVIHVPLTEFTGRVVGIVHRENDVEDKLIAAPEGAHFSRKELETAVEFQERYYRTRIETAEV